MGSLGGWFPACRAHADALAWHWPTASVPAASLLYGQSEASDRGSCEEQWGPGLSLAPTQHALPGLCILTDLPCYHLGLVLGSGLSGVPSTPRLWAQRWARWLWKSLGELPPLGLSQFSSVQSFSCV